MNFDDKIKCTNIIIMVTMISTRRSASSESELGYTTCIHCRLRTCGNLSVYRDALGIYSLLPVADI